MALENTDLFLIQDKDTKANYQVSYETLTDDLVIDLNLADLGQWVPTNGTLFPKVATNDVALGNTVADPRIKFTAETGSAEFDGSVKVNGIQSGIESLISNGTVSTTIKDGNTQDLYVGTKGSTAVFRVEYDGSITATSFTGPVTGDITGDITGNINGNVNGNVTGDLTGDVTGDVNGNVTGDLTGDVTGNLTGNVDGNVTGDLTGDVTGNLTGDVNGDVTGNLTGNVNGNVTGDITGDLSGNADTATKLKTARTIALSGDVSGSASFDGSGNISITSTVADDSHNHVISNVDGLQTALDGKLSTSGKAADSEKLDGIDSSSFLRSDIASDADGAINFRAGAGAALIQANSDIRFENGTWTGDACKIQLSGNKLEIQGGPAGINFRDSGGSNNATFNSSGNFLAGADSGYDLGASGTLWRRVYSKNYSLESLPTLP